MSYDSKQKDRKTKWANKSTKEQDKAKEHALAERTKTQKYEQSNSEFAQKNGEFIDACELVDIKPTARQASKFRNKRGKAYTELIGV